MSRTVPRDARQGWPDDVGRDHGYGEGQGVAGSGSSNSNGTYPGQGYGDHGYAVQGHDGDGYQGQGYGAAAYDGNGHPGQGYGAQGYDGQAYDTQGYDGQGYDTQGYEGQGYEGQGYDGQAYDGQAYDGQAYDGQWSAAQGQGYGDQATWQYDGYDGQQPQQPQQHEGYEGYGDPRQHPGGGYQDPGYAGASGGPDQGYGAQQAWQQDGYDGQAAPQSGYRGQDGGPTAPRSGYQGQAGPPDTWPPIRRRGRLSGPDPRKVRFRRLRRFARRPAVRVVAAIFAVFFIWVMFSAGQAAFKNNGQGFSANLAEWARDHYLGPVVTFGEWLSYNPPKVGGEPTFAYTVPKGEQLTAPGAKGKHTHKGFVPDIPATVKSLAAGTPLSGEGQWRVVEKVKGAPAILITYLRDGGQYTSYSNGIASFDQRLVRFSLRPGTEDPGSAPNSSGYWGVPDYVPSGQRTSLLATFNGGFKLDSAGGGFYLNGMYHGSLVNGTASIVYYKNGTVRIGEWGRDFRMNSSIEGVRQNLQLLVDHGKVSPNANGAVNTPAWGATLGGGYWVWRSGIGITKDHRILFVYGEKLDAQDLADLLQRAGAVEGMQMDINPAWMKFDYYQADGHASDPTPVPLLPDQQPSPYSYYSPSTRDFTVVYAR